MRACTLTTTGNTISAVKLGLPVFGRASDVVVRNWDAVLRWGNSSNLDGTVEHEINPSAAILRVCDKLESTLDMSEVVHTPTVYERMVPRGSTAVIRTMEHAHGEGFETHDGPYRIPTGKYGTQLIRTDREYRVWYAFGAMRCARRVSLNPGTDHAICRSKWGYQYMDTVFPILKTETEKAFTRMGLETGAADVLWVEAERKWYFLELNSAPAIDTESLERFFRNAVASKLRSMETAAAVGRR